MNESPSSVRVQPTGRISPGVLAAWVVILLTSLLPRVILQEVFGQIVSPDLQVGISLTVILAGLLATVASDSLRRLRPFLILMLVLVGAEWLVFNRLDRLPYFSARLNSPSFSTYMLAEQLLRLTVTLVIIAALFLVRRRPRDFFLAPGDLAAPVQPTRWLGVGPGLRWNRFGLVLTVLISLGTLAFLLIAGRPSPDLIQQALPFLPVIFLAAAMNAFNEEMTYKASILSLLESPVGGRQALFLVAAYFGIGHFYGVPYGITGVLLAGFLGWILARSMMETRGLFWAWFIHFWQDVWIFSFLALGAIQAGGG